METANPSCSFKDTNSQVGEDVLDFDDDLVFDSDDKFYFKHTKESIKLPQQTLETDFKQTDVQEEEENCDNFIKSQQQKENHEYVNSVEHSSNKWQEICNSFEDASITSITNGSATSNAANYSGINLVNDGKFNEGNVGNMPQIQGNTGEKWRKEIENKDDNINKSTLPVNYDSDNHNEDILVIASTVSMIVEPKDKELPSTFSGILSNTDRAFEDNPSDGSENIHSPSVKNDSEQMLFQKKAKVEELLNQTTSSEDDGNNKLCRRRSMIPLPVKNDSEQMLFQKKANVEALLDLATSSEDDGNKKLYRRRSLSTIFVLDIGDGEEIINRKLHKRSMSFHGRKSVR